MLYNNNRELFLSQLSLLFKEVMLPQNFNLVLENILKIITENFKLQFAWLGFLNEKNKAVIPYTFREFSQEYINQIEIKYDNSKLGCGPTGMAIKTKKYVLNNNLEKNINFKPWVRAAKKFRFKSSAAFPLLISNKVIGILNIYSKKENFFTEELAVRLQLLADFMAIAIQNALNFEKLQNEKIQWERTFNAIEDFVTVIDKNFRIIKANHSLCKFLGKSEAEIINKKCFEIYHQKMCPYKKCVLKKIFKTLASITEEFTDKNTQKKYLITTSPLMNTEGEINSIIHIVKDVTKIQHLKENIIQLEKMSATGELIASITNELKKPLETINCYAKILKNKTINKELNTYLKIMVRELENIDSLLEKLSKVIKQKKPICKKVNLNEIIINLSLLLNAQLKAENITIFKELAENLPLIEVDHNQMQQVLLNLILNAQNALKKKEENNKFIKIKTYTATCFLPHKNQEYKNKKAICIEISDNGLGIVEKIKGKIFEPFFTGTENSTGLGLSICFEIIKKHKGNIYVKNTKLGLTTFAVELPL